MLEWGDVKNREEYEQYWLEEYPDPVCWYELVIVEAFHKDGSRWFRAVHFGDKPIINAHFDYNDDEKTGFTNREEAVIALCALLAEPVMESMRRLKEGTYNEFVKANLPYSFRTGVIPRAVLWEREPEWKESDIEGLLAETISAFRALLNSGINRRNRIGRLKSMTANDFFRACAIGYKACGYNGTELPPVDQYFLHGDGRDEGLSGRGHGLNAGPGIDFDDPAAWDEWYFHREQHGGHPWEVCLMDIADDWRQQFNMDLYIQTYDMAIDFAKEYPETLWCYGNHDVCYLWNQRETGYSKIAPWTVCEKLRILRESLPDERQLAYLHRIDNVLFSHGGLTDAFVRRYVPAGKYNDIDTVIDMTNGFGCGEMWQDASPIWYRPQYYEGKLYKPRKLLQVVGHTPVERISRKGNLISCDVFSTDSSGELIGTQEYPVIDTNTWDYFGVR